MNDKITEDNINDLAGTTITSDQPQTQEQPQTEPQVKTVETLSPDTLPAEPTPSQPVEAPTQPPVTPEPQPVPAPLQPGQEVSISDKMAQLDAAIAQAQQAAQEYQQKISDLSNNENFFKSNATVQDQQAFETKKELTKRKLEAQPKVTVLVPLQGQEKVGTILPVTINGYVTEIPKGQYVEVPQQVGDIIRESLNQTIAAESYNPFNLNNADPEKKKALNA